MGLDLLVLVVHRVLRDPRVTPALPDQRGILANGDLLDQKALGVSRVPLDLLEAELEGPLFLAPRDLGVLLALPDLKVMLVQSDLLDPLAPQESVDRPDRMRLHPNLMST